MVPISDAEFAQQWDLDSLPACAVGLVLLKQFAERAPRLYALAEHADFIDLVDAPFARNPLWRGFLAHCATCDDCNEV